MGEEDCIKSFACKVIPFLSNVSCGIQSKSTLYTVNPQYYIGVCTVALFPSIASNNPLNERGIIPGFPASPKTVCVYPHINLNPNLQGGGGGGGGKGTFPDPVTPIVNKRESFP